MCSELPIFLDDAQHVSDDLKKTVIYMIANGKGKARGSKTGGIRDTPYWHTVCISTSEHPLHESSPHEGARAPTARRRRRGPPLPQGNEELRRRAREVDCGEPRPRRRAVHPAHLRVDRKPVARVAAAVFNDQARAVGEGEE